MSQGDQNQRPIETYEHLVNRGAEDDLNPRSLIYGSPIGRRFFDISLDTSTSDRHSKAAISACRRFIAGECSGIVLTGAVGTGKSHLLIATILDLARQAMASDTFEEIGGISYAKPMPRIVYFKSADFAARLREGQYDMRTRASTSTIFALDDLGVEMESDFMVSVLQEVFDARYENMLRTFVTTNLSTVDINRRYSERLLSRWGHGYELIRLNGPDRRVGQ